MPSSSSTASFSSPSSSTTTEDVHTSAKEFVNQVEGVMSCYRRGSKAFELGQRTQRPLIEISNSLTKGSQALEDLGNSADVMKSHATSANTATIQIAQSEKSLSDCSKKLMAVWGHVTGAKE